MPDAGKKLVVVTRPRDQAEPVALHIEQLGYDVLIEPMLEIYPLAVSLPPLDRYAALVFTSANGARALASLSPERGLPAYAVGEGTAAVLAEAGFRDIHTGMGDSSDLGALIAAQLKSPARILHLSGTEIARDLAKAMPTGIELDRVALYGALPASRLSERLADALYACTIDSVLLYSPRTAFTFGTLIVSQGLVEKCSEVRALCLSHAVAAQAALLPWRKIEVAASPTTDALLALLPPVVG